MKKNFKSDFATSSTSNNSISKDRFGFTPAKNVLNTPPEPIVSGQVNKNNDKKSKTWLNFFERLDNEEVNARYSNNIKSSSTEDEPKLSILDRLMKDDIGSFSNHKVLNHQLSSTSENSYENQQSKNLIDEGINSIFTKKGLIAFSGNNISPIKSNQTLQMTIYSPPKFSNTTLGSVKTKHSPVKRKIFMPIALPFNTNAKILPSRFQLSEYLITHKLLIFTVLYSLSSTRKHKKWENDGFLYYDFTDNQMCLTKALDKFPLARHPTPRLNVAQIEEECVPGHQIFIGGYEVQIQEESYSNINQYIKNEIENEHETNCKKSRPLDDAHFYDSKMDDYLVKTECEEHEIGFGVFCSTQKDNNSSKNSVVSNDVSNISENKIKNKHIENVTNNNKNIEKSINSQINVKKEPLDESESNLLEIAQKLEKRINEIKKEQIE